MGHWCDIHLSLQNGDTPLMVAAHVGFDGCVQLLLDRCAQVNHQNKVSTFRGYSVKSVGCVGPYW